MQQQWFCQCCSIASLLFGTDNSSFSARGWHKAYGVVLSGAVRKIQLGLFPYWLLFIYTVACFNSQCPCPCQLHLCAQTCPDPHILRTACVNASFSDLCVCVCVAVCATFLTCAQNQLVLGRWSSWPWENDNGVIEEAGWMRGQTAQCSFYTRAECFLHGQNEQREKQVRSEGGLM